MRLRRRTPDPAGMHVLVTGAASGMGRAVAEQLGAAGARLHLTDRDVAGLEATRDAVVAAGGRVETTHPADVADPAQVAALAAAVHGRVEAVDAVMNVAGIATWGRVEDLTLELWRGVVEVDLMGPIHVIDAFVPAMIRAGRRGHLVNVSSAAGLVGLPWHAPYSAAKFGLRGVSEVLRFDLARHGIAVTLVCPGAVRTPITGSVTVAGVDTSSDGFRRLRARFERSAVSAETAAERIVAGMLARRYLVFTSPDTRALHALQRHLPSVYALAMDRVNRSVDRAARSWR
ncbi:SDR family oxidoreductase [Rhodococcus aerolatus]